MERIQFNTKSTRIEDNIQLFLQKQFNVSDKSVYYHPLTQNLTYSVLEPRNTSTLFYLPVGVVSSHNVFDNTVINPIVQKIEQIIQPSFYNRIWTSSLYSSFKNMYILNIPNFSTQFFDFTSNTITLNNPNNNIMFSFLCYVSEDCNVDYIEQLVVNENETQLLSQSYISKRLIQNEFGTINVVGISISPNGQTRCKLKIRIHKTIGTGNKIIGNVIISDPIMFQYPGNLLFPQYNNLYQYSIPMFSIFDSLQKSNQSQNFTIMFIFVPFGQITMNNNQIHFPLFSLGQNNPSERYEHDVVYTSKEFVSQTISFTPLSSNINYFDRIPEQRTITLTVNKQSVFETQVNKQVSKTIKLNDFMYVPHLQIVTYNEQTRMLDVHVYLNFNDRISIMGIPVNNIYNFQFSQFGNWLDFILGGTLDNKINPREFFVPVKTFQNFIFRDIVFIDNFYFDMLDFEFDKITISNNVIKPLFYKIVHD